jgi:multimeric flavodoxin WrbA
VKRLLLVYGGHAGGRTERLVRAVQQGVLDAAADVTLVLRPALEASPADLLDAHGVLLATPEHFGYMSGALKDFFDRTFYPVEGRTQGLPYALIVSAGTDGTGTCRAVERIVRGYGWTEIAPPLLVVGEPSEASCAAAAELGATLSVGLAAGIF